MSYQLTKSNGNILTTISDGQIDTSTTDLSLVGRNVDGYGEFLNQNFVSILENFSNNIPPQAPLEGQLWWNSLKKRLEVYNGASWNVYGTAKAQSTEPELVAGDLWLDTGTGQLKTSDGDSSVLIGPVYKKDQGKSGFVIETFRDILGNNQTVSSFYNAGERVAILSNKEFFLDPSNTIDGLSSNIVKKGLEPLGVEQSWLHGVAESAKSLYVGESLPLLEASHLMRKDDDNTTIGTITVKNNNGIIIGLPGSTVSHSIAIDNSENSYVIRSSKNDQNIVFETTSSQHGDATALKISPSKKGIAVFGSDPHAELHVFGSAILEDNFHVRGTQVVLDVDYLKTSAKRLELGIYEDGSFVSDPDNSGIAVQADKTLTWSQSTQSWKSSHGFDSSEDYKINGSSVLTHNSLIGITHATDLQEIGTLDSLAVDAVTIDENFVSSSGDLLLRSTSSVFIDAPVVEVGGAVIEGVGTPVNENDAANKNYVDSSVQSTDIVMTFDITGLGDASQTMEDAVAEFIADLVDPVSSPDGRIAKIHACDHSVNPPSRKLIAYICSGNQWVWQSTTDY